MYVVVDWRPYELPEVYGVFDSEKKAEDFGVAFFGVDPYADNFLKDGICVREVQIVTSRSLPQMDYDEARHDAGLI